MLMVAGSFRSFLDGFIPLLLVPKEADKGVFVQKYPLKRIIFTNNNSINNSYKSQLRAVSHNHKWNSYYRIPRFSRCIGGPEKV